MTKQAWERRVVVGPFQCNCRILVCPKTLETVIVDPGDEASHILKQVSDWGTELGKPLQVKALIHTHGHLDHVGATRGVKENLGGAIGPKLYIHRGDEPLYLALKTQGQMFGFNYDDPLPIEKYLEDEEELKFGTLKLKIIHTPGHSPGSVSLQLAEDSDAQTTETVFTGDTLFQGSVGRTDLWGADQDTMFTSIRKRLLTLNDGTRVCPGHGPDSEIGIEKRSNPFLV
jgi:hydroxyacylglutathione hydrolase